MSDALRRLVELHGGSYHGTYVSLPGPGHSRKDRSLAVKEGAEGRLVFYSHAGDSDRDCMAYLGISGSTPLASLKIAARAPQGAERTEKLQFCAKLWREAKPMSDDPGAWYLYETRGVDFASPHLRYHPKVPTGYRSDTTSPGILGFVTDQYDRACGLHATLIESDGSGKRKRLMYGFMQGASVRLAEPGSLGIIGLCEGIETSLAFADVQRVPTWAALSAGGIKGFEPPRGIRRIIVGADNDDRGTSLKAARDLALRLNRRCDVVIMTAPSGRDWNDVVRERRA